jgi:hypothetical protein
VTFVDVDHGFAAGGTPAKYNGSQLLEATDDGGRSWQVRWSTPFDGYGGGGGKDNGVIRLAFADDRHGYALTGGCVDGQSGPCGGDLFATSDAGNSWHPLNREGLVVAIADDQLAYLSGSPNFQNPPLSRTTDAGADWSTSPAPRRSPVSQSPAPATRSGGRPTSAPSPVPTVESVGRRPTPQRSARCAATRIRCRPRNLTTC